MLIVRPYWRDYMSPERFLIQDVKPVCAACPVVAIQKWIPRVSSPFGQQD